jgi:hypothetical protein
MERRQLRSSTFHTEKTRILRWAHDVYDQDEEDPDHKKFAPVESASQQFD